MTAAHRVLEIALGTAVLLLPVAATSAAGVIPIDAGPFKYLPCDGGTVQLEGCLTDVDPDYSVIPLWTASDGGHLVSGDRTWTPVVDTPGTYTVEACWGYWPTPICATYDSTLVLEHLPGDADANGLVDRADHALFVAHLAGPEQHPPDGYGCSDLDNDDDVDLIDFAWFQRLFAGAVPPVTGACCDSSIWLCEEVTQAECLAAGRAYHGDGGTCDQVNCHLPGFTNELEEPQYALFSGAGVEMADDLWLAGEGPCFADSYSLVVWSDVGGTFDVSVSLYEGVPGDGGAEIAGTANRWVGLPADGTNQVLEIDLQADPLVPEVVWMMVIFSTDYAGWFMAQQPELGCSIDWFRRNDPTEGWHYYWFSGGPEVYSAFYAAIECVPSP